MNLIRPKLYDIVKNNLELKDVCKNKPPNKGNLFSIKSFNRKKYLEHHNIKKIQFRKYINNYIINKKRIIMLNNLLNN